jgi:hypothetical protein
MNPELGGLAFQLCIFFVRNPGRVLFSDEVCSMWGVTPTKLTERLVVARRDGWLIGNKTEAGEFYLCAGPALEATK